MLHVVMRAAWGPPARHAGGQCACGTHSTSALAKGGRWAGPVPAKPLTPTMSTVPVGDGPGCDARAGALDTRAALAALVAAARAVLAALAADPSAVDRGPVIPGDGEDVAGDAPASANCAADGDALPEPALRAALGQATEDYKAARARLLEALIRLRDATAAGGGGRGDIRERSTQANALEPRVAALRAAVDRGNAGLRDLADRLSVLVDDVDAWRAGGAGLWPGGTGGG